MKTTLLIFCLCLFLAPAAFGQYGGTLNSQIQFYQPPDHPAHASYAPMSSEQSIVGGTSYAMAQGDRPASDFPQRPQASLGDVARELRKQHELVKKARIVWIN
ncbi:MAG: hypothetical protein WBS24_00135 [Terriglobales bacterium]